MKYFFSLALLLCPLITSSQVKINKQQHFPKTVPAGNYSGITALGDDRYAVVSDKSEKDGFFVFHIVVDSLTGRIRAIDNEGFRATDSPNRDQEGIAYFPQKKTVFISGEADNRILEYTLDNKNYTRYTGRSLAIPEIFKTATANYGFESLSYNAKTHRFWTTTESTLPADGTQAIPQKPVANKLRIQSFDDNLQPVEQYFYEMDMPEAKKRPAMYAMGVSELCAMDDGGLLVLEREFYVSQSKLGSFVSCKIYRVEPSAQFVGKLLPKRLLVSFRTRLTLFGHGIANYEGMCLGPRLKDGRQTLILVSDSQDQYKGVLKDWFKTIVF